MVERLTGWGEDKILCNDKDGNSRTFFTSWTDYPTDGPENPFLGTIDFCYDDLKMLAKMIADIEKM